jgi:hypothetical protein
MGFLIWDTRVINLLGIEAALGKRLDRAIACDDWREKFPNARVENLDYSRSDHRSMFLSFGVSPILDIQGPSLLRFEA